MRRWAIIVSLVGLLSLRSLAFASNYVSPNFTVRDPTINGATILGQTSANANSQAAAPTTSVVSNSPPLAVPLIVLLGGSLLAAVFWSLGIRSTKDR